MINPSVVPSERIFSPQTVCVPLSGMLIARGFNPKIPATKAEVLALANDMGAPNGIGANFAKLAAGMQKRYKLSGKVIEGAAAAIPAVRAATLKGPCIIGLAGDQLNLTPHWQTHSVGHAIAVFYPMGTVGIQLDPLAPNGYVGDMFTDAELVAFCTAAIIFDATPDCSAAVKAATDPLNTKIASAQAALK